MRCCVRVRVRVSVLVKVMVLVVGAVETCVVIMMADMVLARKKSE